MTINSDRKTRRIFFRNNGLSPLEIAKFWRSNQRLNLDWPQLKDRTIIYSYLGRIGNALVCRMLNVQPGDEVLVPSYNCGSEVDPFLSFGMKAVMYHLDDQLTIDLGDLKKRITNRTRIIYVTHYFGWPQPLQDVKKLCQEHNLFLMEDCALSLFSNSSDKPIGKDGDAAIFSFRKSLPVPDGAALSLRENEILISRPHKRPPFRTTVKETAPYIVRWLLHSGENNKVVSSALAWAESLLPAPESERLTEDLDMPKDYYFSETIMPFTISRISAGILSSVDPQRVYDARRQNYQRLFEGIVDIKSLKPLFNLPDGVCPLFMAVRVEDVFLWMYELNGLGIKAIRWWEGFNKKLDWSEFPHARSLKNGLMVLPVHQFLTPEDIDYMIDGIRKTSHKLGFNIGPPLEQKPIKAMHI